jgi:hypothetical protein
MFAVVINYQRRIHHDNAFRSGGGISTLSTPIQRGNHSQPRARSCDLRRRANGKAIQTPMTLAAYVILAGPG